MACDYSLIGCVLRVVDAEWFGNLMFLCFSLLFPLCRIGSIGELQLYSRPDSRTNGIGARCGRRQGDAADILRPVVKRRIRIADDFFRLQISHAVP